VSAVPASVAGRATEAPGPGRSRLGGVARLLPVLAPVTVAGAAALAAAAWSLAISSPSARAAGAIAVLTLAATLAEAFPVPVAAFPAGTISLAAVFIVAVAVLFGWPAAVVAAFIARAAVEILQRRPLSRLVYNGALYALSGLAAGVGAAAAHERGVVALRARPSP
jgi:hypothetical protein